MINVRVKLLFRFKSILELLNKAKLFFLKAIVQSGVFPTDKNHEMSITGASAQIGKLHPDPAKFWAPNYDLVSCINSIFLKNQPRTALMGCDDLEIHRLSNEMGQISFEQLTVPGLSVGDNLDMSTNWKGRVQKEGRSSVAVVI